MDRERRTELLARALSHSSSGDIIGRLCVGAAALCGVDEALVAGISESGGAEVAAASGPLARRIVSVEFELGEGPLLTAHEVGVTVSLPALTAPAAAERWPMYATAAAEAGAGAVFAFPARLGGARVGAFVLVRRSSGALGRVDEERAVVLAEVATLLLLDRMAGTARDGEIDPGWPTRAVVHQATGITAVQLGVGLPMALARLRAYAFVERRSLDDVSRDIVERRLRLEP